MLRFSSYYLTITILLFLTEVLIAAYLHDQIIRPYGGDFLVVILLYCLVKTFLHSPVNGTAIAVLLFAYGIETLQYFHFVKVIGLGGSAIANIVLGNFFAWGDMLAYTLGIILVISIEQIRSRQIKVVDN